MPVAACPDTYHIERHDNHKVDADTSAGGGKLPVLLHKIPVEGGKFLHRDETENHHSKHGCQNEGDLIRDKEEGTTFVLASDERRWKLQVQAVVICLLTENSCAA